MNQDQTEAIGAKLAENRPPGIGVRHLLDQRERTLVYGYESNSDEPDGPIYNTVHVYLKDGLIHRYIYQGTEAGEETVVDYFAASYWPDARDLVPAKRSYPESTSFDFAYKMADLGVSLNPTTFDENRHKRVSGLLFHGLVNA
jgi:hypothetical protein